MNDLPLTWLGFGLVVLFLIVLRLSLSQRQEPDAFQYQSSQMSAVVETPLPAYVVNVGTCPPPPYEIVISNPTVSHHNDAPT